MSCLMHLGGLAAKEGRPVQHRARGPGAARRAPKRRAALGHEDPAHRPVCRAALAGEAALGLHERQGRPREAHEDALGPVTPIPTGCGALAGEIKQHVIENLDTLPAAGRGAASRPAGRRSTGRSTPGPPASRCWRSCSDGARRAWSRRRRWSARRSSSGISSRAAASSASRPTSGEFIIQIDHDHPCHIVRPIIHKNRREIATSFEKNGLGAYNDEPEVITRRARTVPAAEVPRGRRGPDRRQLRRGGKRTARAS